jgi:uncharacterized membrane protein
MGVLDFLWLTNMLGPVYRPAIGSLLAEKPHMGAAVTFYVIYLAGIQIFAVSPALATADWRTASVHGALFGFFAYATYDMTNLATLRNWSLKMSLIDMAWGSVLTAITASAGAFAALKLVG